MVRTRYTLLGFLSVSWGERSSLVSDSPILDCVSRLLKTVIMDTVRPSVDYVLLR